MTPAEKFMKGILESNINFSIKSDNVEFVIFQYIKDKLKYIFIDEMDELKSNSLLEVKADNIGVIKNNTLYIYPYISSYKIRKQIINEILGKYDDVYSLKEEFENFCLLLREKIIPEEIAKHSDELDIVTSLSEKDKNECIKAVKETLILKSPMSDWLQFSCEEVDYKDFLEILNETLTPEELIETLFEDRDVFKHYMYKDVAQKYYKSLLQNGLIHIDEWVLKLAEVCKNNINKIKTVDVLFEINGNVSLSKIYLKSVYDKLIDYEKSSFHWHDFVIKNNTKEIYDNLGSNINKGQLFLEHIIEIRYKNKTICHK